MKYLKTYEGLFDFFKKKKKEETIIKDDTEFLDNHLDDVKDCFLELTSEQNLNLDVYIDDSEILVDLWKSGVQMDENGRLSDNRFIKLEDLIETFKFTQSYLNELGLKINRYEFHISGFYDNTNYMGDIYLDDDWELEHNLDQEGFEHIESVLIRITKNRN